MYSEIRAIVGLGNPGPRYLETRHNAGWWFLDALSTRHPLELRDDGRMHGAVGELRIDGARCRVLRPDTFMNRSGQSVAALTSYFKIPVEQVLVVYDDLDLPPGVARFKNGGGHGGHNGLRDIMRHLGGDFARLRLGIGHPGDRDRVVDYVLTRPSQAERHAIDDAIDAAVGVMPDYLSGERQKATMRLHTAARADNSSDND